MLNKRGQMADTMTWVVATLVIVVILGILVFVTMGISGDKPIFLEDKKKDFIATKSITSFLSDDENVGLLKEDNKEKNYAEFGEKMKNLLGVLSIYKLPYPIPGDEAHSDKGMWGVELNENDENKIRIYCNGISSRNLDEPFLLTTNSNLEKLKLNFGVDECFK